MEEIYKFWECEGSPGKSNFVEIKILHKSKSTAVDFCFKKKKKTRKRKRKKAVRQCILMLWNVFFLKFLALKLFFQFMFIYSDLSRSKCKQKMEFHFQDYLKYFRFCSNLDQSQSIKSLETGIIHSAPRGL